VKIQQQGQRVTTAHFVLIVAPTAPAAPPPGASGQPATAGSAATLAPGRLGVTASKQVGNAALRARCKRLVREAFRLDPGLLPRGVDLVVIVKAGAHELGLSGVQAEWSGVRGLLARRASGVLRAK